MFSLIPCVEESSLTGIISGEHLQAHVKQANRRLYDLHETALSSLNGWMSYKECRSQIEALNDLDLLRLFLEYLPLTFSRRHGDPSRPWNKFVIKTHDLDGRPCMSYQGNWRDIFSKLGIFMPKLPTFPRTRGHKVPEHIDYGRLQPVSYIRQRIRLGGN